MDLEGGSWFKENVCRKVGSGTYTLLWLDRLVGEVPLGERFSRLFDLAVDKWVSLAHMQVLGWGRAVRLVSGGVVCWLGRRSWPRTVRWFFLTFNCLLM